MQRDLFSSIIFRNYLFLKKKEVFMKTLSRLLITIIVCLTLAVIPAYANDMKPGKGTTVQPARATWNTGFFQEAMARRGLEELGYKLQKDERFKLYLTNTLEMEELQQTALPVMSSLAE